MRLISPHKNIELQRDAYRNQGSNLDLQYEPEAWDWFRRVELTGATFGPNALAIAINKLALRKALVESHDRDCKPSYRPLLRADPNRGDLGVGSAS